MLLDGDQAKSLRQKYNQILESEVNLSKLYFINEKLRPKMVQ